MTAEDYYEAQAMHYFYETVGADVSSVRTAFLERLPEGARILDLGCGSGRDLRVFQKAGFQAVGIERSKKLAALAQDYSGTPVIQADFLDYRPDIAFDGLYALASLVHLTKEERAAFFRRIPKLLKHGGIFFFSVKSGIQSGYDAKGRYFENFDEEELQFFRRSPAYEILKVFKTEDALGRSVSWHWANVLIRFN